MSLVQLCFSLFFCGNFGICLACYILMLFVVAFAKDQVQDAQAQDGPNLRLDVDDPSQELPSGHGSGVVASSSDDIAAVPSISGSGSSPSPCPSDSLLEVAVSSTSGAPFPCASGVVADSPGAALCASGVRADSPGAPSCASGVSADSLLEASVQDASRDVALVSSPGVASQGPLDLSEGGVQASGSLLDVALPHTAEEGARQSSLDAFLVPENMFI